MPIAISTILNGISSKHLLIRLLWQKITLLHIFSLDHRCLLNILLHRVIITEYVDGNNVEIIPPREEGGQSALSFCQNWPLFKNTFSKFANTSINIFIFVDVTYYLLSCVFVILVRLRNGWCLKFITLIIVPFTIRGKFDS